VRFDQEFAAGLPLTQRGPSPRRGPCAKRSCPSRADDRRRRGHRPGVARTGALAARVPTRARADETTDGFTWFAASDSAPRCEVPCQSDGCASSRLSDKPGAVEERPNRGSDSSPLDGSDARVDTAPRRSPLWRPTAERCREDFSRQPPSLATVIRRRAGAAAPASTRQCDYWVEASVRITDAGGVRRRTPHLTRPGTERSGD
jgi:hypothetical protein